MRRVFILIAFLLASLSILGAQETKRFSLGIGVEANNNTRVGAAMGETMYFGCSIIQPLEAGVSVGFSYDFNRVMVLEPAAAGRWYFYHFMENRFFAQADLGASIVLEEKDTRPYFLGGLTLGVQLSLNEWYVEPYARGGYPFVWGTGVKAGYRF
jgi:hypothetical protein